MISEMELDPSEGCTINVDHQNNTYTRNKALMRWKRSLCVVGAQSDQGHAGV